MRPYIEVRSAQAGESADVEQDCEDAKAKRTKLPKPVIFVVIARLPTSSQALR